MLLYNIIVRHINLLQKWFLKHNLAEDEMWDYEAVIYTEEMDLQRKLRVDFWIASILAAFIGAFLLGCVALIIYAVFTPEAIPMIEHGVPVELASCGASIGAIGGIMLVRRVFN